MNLDDDERALLVFDEVYGILPAHPADPPTQRPVAALMKQTRALLPSSPNRQAGAGSERC